MFGHDGDIRGLIPRSVEYLFQNLAQRTASYEVAMVCSFLEIYNDQIRDLGKAYLVAMGVESSTSTALYEKTSDVFENLAIKRRNTNFAPAFQRGNLVDTEELLKRPGLKEVSDQYKLMNYEIREDTEGNVFVKDLSLIPVTTIDEVISLISMGLKVRATHETKMNATSSRSHTVFTITVIQRDKSTGQAFSGMLNLVDLAGSERIKKSESQGIRLREALHINTSLTALGKVITALDPTSESTHIPYRDSKLTRILQNSLGGNSFTTVIAAIHPNVNYYDECLSTLQFANRCRNVTNTPKVNYVSDNEDKDRKIRRLLDDVQQMKLKLGQTENIGSVPGGGGGGAAAAHASAKELSPAKLVDILKKLGLKAELASDGGVILDGKKISTSLLGLGQGSTSDDTLDSNSRPLTSSSSSNKGNDKVRVQLTEAQDQLKLAHETNRERKEIIEKQSGQIKKLSTDLIKYQTGLKHKEFQYDTLMQEKDRALKELEEKLVREFESQNKSIINQNQKLLTQQHNTLQKFPRALKDYSDLYKKLQEENLKDTEPLIAEHKRQLASWETSLKDQMENLKQQYEHWLFQKDKALQDYVKKFNEYKQKKSDQLNKCELEVVRLHDHVEKVEAILIGFEKGEYPVVQKQGYHGRPTTGVILAIDSDIGTLPNLTSHMGTGTAGSTNKNGFLGYTKAGSIVIPKGLRPRNPLKPDKVTGEMSLAKKIVMKYREQERAILSEKNDNIQQAQLLTSMGTLDPEIQKQIQDMIDQTVSKSSVGSSKNKSKPSQNEDFFGGNYDDRDVNRESIMREQYYSNTNSHQTKAPYSAPEASTTRNDDNNFKNNNTKGNSVQFTNPDLEEELNALREENAQLKAEQFETKVNIKSIL